MHAGISKDGFVRHFFHRPSKAYTTGTRKRRKVHADIDGNETRWHKTGKTRPVCVQGNNKMIKGYKKILVLYTNYGKQRKPEKTNWVMHQYHLGNNDDEKEGELVVSKIFYQTQPRQCSNVTNNNSNIITTKDADRTKKPTNGVLNIANHKGGGSSSKNNNSMFIDYYHHSLISFNQTT